MSGKTTAQRLVQHLDTNGKEYYEQLKKRIVWTDAHGNRFVTADEIEYKRLVEQAERAQGLGEQNEWFRRNMVELKADEVFLRKEIKRLREALGFYADAENYVIHEGTNKEIEYWFHVHFDEGDIARQALEGVK